MRRTREWARRVLAALPEQERAVLHWRLLHGYTGLVWAEPRTTRPGVPSRASVCTAGGPRG